jgi:phospholipase/carboxylesterase
MAALSHIHRFEPGADPVTAPVLLLHGTGGDEDDLLPLGRRVAPGAPLLSPRGAVLEGGMPRFFRRLSEGVFDEDDLRRRGGDLADFVVEARKAYGIGAPVALGYSNGANIAAAMMLLRPGTLRGAILIRAMATLADPPKADLVGVPVLILSGAQDPIVPASSAERLAESLEASGARVEHETLLASHGLTQADLARAARFYAKEFSGRSV